MLLEIHLFLTIITFILLIIGLVSKQQKNKLNPRTNTNEPSDVRGNIPLLLTAAFLFFFLAYTSLDVDYYTCHNQITWMNNTAENDTMITNQISCVDQKIVDQPLSSLYLGMGVLSILLSIFFVINILRDNVR